MHILRLSEGGMSKCRVLSIRGTISVERRRYVRIYVRAEDAKELLDCHGKRVEGLIVVREQ
jgi:hypothetical protein